MVVRIRLARFGRTNAPFYNIVVAQARTARNSRPMEVLGTYDPIPKKDPYDDSGRLHKDIKLDTTRAKYWIGVGAQPTDTVWRLLSMLGILEPKYRPEKTNKNPVEKFFKHIEEARSEEKRLRLTQSTNQRSDAEASTPPNAATTAEPTL